MAQAVNPFQLDDPNSILASQNEEIGNKMASPNLGQRGEAIGSLFSRFAYGNPQVDKARNIQNANQTAQAQLAPQGAQESDIDYALRSAHAMHDAVAPYDSGKASQILEHIVTLNEQKTQQELLTETRKAGLAENILSKGSYVVGTPDGSKTIWRGDVLNPDGSLNKDSYDAMQTALKSNPGMVRQTEEQWAGSKARITDMQVQGKLDAVRMKALMGQDPLSSDVLPFAIADVRANPSNMRIYAGMGQAGQDRRDQINEAIAQDNKRLGLSPGDVEAYRAQVKANTGSMAQLQKFQSMLSVNAGLAHNNGDRLLALVDQVNPSNFTDLNAVVQFAKKHTSDAATNEFASVLNTFQTEAARIIAGSPSGAGVLSDHAREELQKIVNGTLAPAALKQVVRRLFTEFDVKNGMYKSQIQEMAGGISNAAAGQSPYATPSAATIAPTQTPAATVPLKSRIDAILGGH
jgi:hypothetical protein